MKNVLLMMGVLLLSTSCLTLDGQLRVSESFMVKKKGGFLNLKLKDVKVEPAVYSASLKVKSDKNYTLELSGGNLGKILVPIKAASDLEIPTNGAFSLSHEKIKNRKKNRKKKSLSRYIFQGITTL